MTSTNNEDSQDLQEQLSTLRNDFSDVAKTVREMSVARTRQGQERLRNAAGRTRAQARDSWNTVQGEIEQRPYTSMAVAFGAGLLIGKLFDR